MFVPSTVPSVSPITSDVFSPCSQTGPRLLVSSSCAMERINKRGPHLGSVRILRPEILQATVNRFHPTTKLSEPPRISIGLIGFDRVGFASSSTNDVLIPYRGFCFSLDVTYGPYIILHRPESLSVSVPLLSNPSVYPSIRPSLTEPLTELQHIPSSC